MAIVFNRLYRRMLSLCAFGITVISASVLLCLSFAFEKLRKNSENICIISALFNLLVFTFGLYIVIFSKLLVFLIARLYERKHHGDDSSTAQPQTIWRSLRNRILKDGSLLVCIASSVAISWIHHLTTDDCFRCSSFPENIDILIHSITAFGYLLNTFFVFNLKQLHHFLAVHQLV